MEKHQVLQLEQLTKKQIFLKWRCEQLISYNEALCKRRSVSECSNSTISSTNSYELTRSSSSICESGELKQKVTLISYIRDISSYLNIVIRCPYRESKMNYFLFSDEIDVIGACSQSDSDDHLSVQSLKSAGSVDSGIVLKSTSRLTLGSTGKTSVA